MSRRAKAPPVPALPNGRSSPRRGEHEDRRRRGSGRRRPRPRHRGQPARPGRRGDFKSVREDGDHRDGSPPPGRTSATRSAGAARAGRGWPRPGRRAGSRCWRRRSSSARPGLPAEQAAQRQHGASPGAGRRRRARRWRPRRARARDRLARRVRPGVPVSSTSAGRRAGAPRRSQGAAGPARDWMRRLRPERRWPSSACPRRRGRRWRRPRSWRTGDRRASTRGRAAPSTPPDRRGIGRTYQRIAVFREVVGRQAAQPPATPRAPVTSFHEYALALLPYQIGFLRQTAQRRGASDVRTPDHALRSGAGRDARDGDGRLRDRAGPGRGRAARRGCRARPAASRSMSARVLRSRTPRVATIARRAPAARGLPGPRPGHSRVRPPDRPVGPAVQRAVRLRRERGLAAGPPTLRSCASAGRGRLVQRPAGRRRPWPPSAPAASR